MNPIHHDAGLSYWDVGRGISAATSIFGVVNQDAVISVVSALCAAAMFAWPVLTRLRGEWRKASVQQDQDEAKSWGSELGKAQAEIEVLRAKIDMVQARFDSQSAELRGAKAKLAQLTAASNGVLSMVRGQREQLKRADNRVRAIEESISAGPASDLRPALPPPEPTEPTDMDMPQIDL